MKMVNPNRSGIVKRELRILVADRNRHIRDFLKRELTAVHHDVHLAGSAGDMLAQIQQQLPEFDLVIVDPHFPELEDPRIIRQVMQQIRSIPVVVHTYQSNLDDTDFKGPLVSVVEKKGNSIDLIKHVVLNIQSGISPPETVTEGEPQSLIKLRKL